MRHYGLVFSLLLAVTACFGSVACSQPGAPAAEQSATAETPEPAATSATPESAETPIPHRLEVVERSVGDCDDPEAPCVSFVARFPRFALDEIAGTPLEGRCRALDAAIDDLLAQSAPGERTTDGVEAQAESFLADWREIAADMPDAPWATRWASERSLEVIFETPHVLSLRLEDYCHTGGAHPNAFTSFASFDPTTGRAYTLDDLLREDGRQQLMALAETAFRTSHGLAPETPLNEAGFSFEANRFTLPENWAIVEDGLRLFYNPYEIGPYALGTTDLTIDRASLAPLLDPSGPLGDLRSSTSMN